MFNTCTRASQEAHPLRQPGVKKQKEQRTQHVYTCKPKAYPPKAARNEDKEEIISTTHVHMQAMRLTPLRRLEEEEKCEKTRPTCVHVQAIRLTPLRRLGAKKRRKNKPDTLTRASLKAHPPKAARNEEDKEITKK